ncbi:MAG: hypothetical protein PUP92_04345 [Rhizonema sp. PD38]|nr:hypothetical protein [Rhizonema sp. PD38]
MRRTSYFRQGMKTGKAQSLPDRGFCPADFAMRGLSDTNYSRCCAIHSFTVSVQILPAVDTKYVKHISGMLPMK